MPSVAGIYSTDKPGLVHPDFVLGDRDGSTSDPAFREFVAAWLRERGYDVSINDPYKGVELVRAFGRPADGRHSLQIEINRKLYMDETTLRPSAGRSEEHTSELQSLMRISYAVFCLKKKKYETHL